MAGVGLSLFAKRLDKGRFIWPQTTDGVVSLTAGQVGHLLEAIDWRIRNKHGGHSLPGKLRKSGRKPAVYF